MSYVKIIRTLRWRFLMYKWYLCPEKSMDETLELICHYIDELNDEEKTLKIQEKIYRNHSLVNKLVYIKDILPVVAKRRKDVPILIDALR